MDSRTDRLEFVELLGELFGELLLLEALTRFHGQCFTFELHLGRLITFETRYAFIYLSYWLLLWCENYENCETLVANTPTGLPLDPLRVPFNKFIQWLLLLGWSVDKILKNFLVKNWEYLPLCMLFSPVPQNGFLDGQNVRWALSSS